jgi:uncharacterized membrane protein
MNYQSLVFWILLAVWGLLFIRVFRQTHPDHERAKDITIDAMFIAIILLMGLVPQLGYIQILPWLSLTLMHLPVLIGAYLYGWKKGALYGFFFGVTSWIVASTRSTGALDLLFIYPWISVLPRLVFGAVSGLLFQLMRKTPKIYSSGVAVGGLSFFLTCLHTVLVFADLYAFYPQMIGSYFRSGDSLTSGILITFLTAVALGMAGEASIAAIAVPVTGKALRKVQGRKKEE